MAAEFLMQEGLLYPQPKFGTVFLVKELDDGTTTEKNKIDVSKF